MQMIMMNHCEHETPMLSDSISRKNNMSDDKDISSETSDGILAGCQEEKVVGNERKGACNADSCTERENTTKETWYSRFSDWMSKHISPDALFPTANVPLTIFSLLVLLLLIWGTLYTLLKNYIAPTSSLFLLLSLFILAYVAGYLISYLRLPPLLGMLLVGILMRNLNIFNMEGPYKIVVSNLRSTAMVVILIKAGLGLDAEALRRLSFVVVRLAFTPCIVEASVIACASHFFLGLPWLWGALLGFVIGAVSPAVVVPSLLALKEKGYGEDKGISTLVIAASSIDDILAISGFGVVLSTIFSGGDVLQQVLQGPLEVGLGLSFGIAWGILAMYIPHKNEEWVVLGRFLMIGLGGLFAVFGSQMAGYSGAGPLASIVMAFVACYGWKNQGWGKIQNPVENCFSSAWKIFQPVLFGLIGTSIDLLTLESRAVGFGIATLAVGLIVRLVTTFFVVCGGTLNLKEMLFVSISWFPKATVQAAIGPVALDLAEKWNSDDVIKEYASLVLTIAVLSIIITAPIGAVGIYLAGPRLLGRVEPESQATTEEVNDSNPV